MAELRAECERLQGVVTSLTGLLEERDAELDRATKGAGGSEVRGAWAGGMMCGGPAGRVAVRGSGGDERLPGKGGRGGR